MLDRLREREEKLLQVLAFLAEQTRKGIPTLVEGKNDIKTLKMLGIEGAIISAKTGGKSLLDVVSEVEKLGVQEAILLFDFDRRGREWTGIVRRQLESVRIKADLSFWLELRRFAGKEVKDVEGLFAYLQTLKKKLGEV